MRDAHDFLGQACVNEAVLGTRQRISDAVRAERRGKQHSRVGQFAPEETPDIVAQNGARLEQTE